MNMLVGLMEKRLLPDAVIRRGIRRLLQKRLQDEYRGDTEIDRQRQIDFFAALRSSPLAIETDAAFYTLLRTYEEHMMELITKRKPHG